MLIVEHLSKRYPGASQDALTDFSLAVAAGSIVCLSGESGSGKTTLLRLVAGFETPDHGRIVLAGRQVADARRQLPPERRGLGMVFQDPALFPHLDVAANIGFALRHADAATRAWRVAELLDLISLPGYERRFPHELSGGQAQRVALARALAPAPALLLLDEPFASLDLRLKREMIGELRPLLQHLHCTAVCVTHDRHDAFALADQLALMRDGRLLQTGSPRELYEAPANPYVAHFFGPCNIVPAQRRDGELHCALGRLPIPANAPEQDECSILVRPDALTVVPPGLGACGKVVGLHYLGDCQDLTVELNAAPGRPLRVYAPNHLRLALHDCIHLTPQPHRCHVLPGVTTATAEMPATVLQP